MTPLPQSLLSQLRSLQSLDTDALRNLYREHYGRRSTCEQPTFLRRAIAFKMQELHYGGLAPERERELARIGETVSATSAPATERPLKPGVRLVRMWHGHTYEVIIRDDGNYEWSGRIFKSLTAAAKAITGMHISGRTFFGVTK